MKIKVFFLLYFFFFLFAAALVSADGGDCVKGDCRDGQGTFTWPNENKYVGEFKNDKFHGQGTKTYGDGIVESGLYIEGKRRF